LINPAVAVNPVSNSNYVHSGEDDASIFTSAFGKPALGKSYAHSIDMSLFLSTVPKSKGDAEKAYAGDIKNRERWKSTYILEVLKDRNGSRQGSWSSFEILDGVRLIHT
jgi:hypothetical protein